MSERDPLHEAQELREAAKYLALSIEWMHKTVITLRERADELDPQTHDRILDRLVKLETDAGEITFVGAEK